MAWSTAGTATPTLHHSPHTCFPVFEGLHLRLKRFPIKGLGLFWEALQKKNSGPCEPSSSGAASFGIQDIPCHWIFLAVAWRPPVRSA